ncbi:hypothetical protein SAMN04488057_101183 [Cyclobacterium lianum]|uniref:Uncharacterized protein n=1 Tax=Cyclobacterium lianum TaxID=388280 RepID=A0A1M7I466_9BACT|nr:hypothetical protein SAMN04488057_101183 [Cyclobacterium lianum]
MHLIPTSHFSKINYLFFALLTNLNPVNGLFFKLSVQQSVVFASNSATAGSFWNKIAILVPDTYPINYSNA